MHLKKKNHNALLGVRSPLCYSNLARPKPLLNAGSSLTGRLKPRAMPSRRSAYGQQGTRSGKRSYRKRKTSVATRIRYQRPTARNQAKQLRSVAKIALYNRRMLTANKVYCDWFDNNTAPTVQSIWFAQELTGPENWTAGNRQDLEFLTSQTAFARNLQLNYYCSSQDKNRDVVFDVYVVSLRNSNASWVPGVYPTGVWSEGLEYATMGGNNSVAVNSGMFKVHYNKQFQLAPKTPDGTETTWAGNPFSTYRNAKVNIALNMKIRAPAGSTWKTLPMSALPPSQRMYLVWRGQSFDNTNQYLLNWGIHVTTVGLS